MSKTTHTPGPWRAIEQGDANAYAVLANNDRWVIAFSQNGEISTEEQKANAKLIEAAPDMLDALIQIAGYEERGRAKGEPRISEMWYELIKETIQKATNETNL